MKVTIEAAEREAEEAAINVYSEVEPVPMTAEVNADVPNLPDRDVEHIKVGINRICRLITYFSHLGLLVLFRSSDLNTRGHVVQGFFLALTKEIDVGEGT
jgi:hypothetical protein